MFHHQSVLCVCTLSIALTSSQSYFHTNHGNGGSFTSISHGGGAAAPHQAAYHAPAQSHHVKPQPFVHRAQTSSYHAPAPSYHAPAQPAYHPPAQPAYHAPAPSYHAPRAHGPAAANYGEKCVLDYVEKSVEVCVPTLETECDQEDGGQGVELHQDEDCHDVVRTVCVERHTVVDNEVCAYSYTLKPVVTEAKLVEAHWEKVCHEDVICLNPHHQASSYGAPAYCHEEIHEACHLEPHLVPVIRPVTISLPQPVEVCINKQIVLPYIECTKVKDRACMLVPRADKGYKTQIDKCQVVLGEPACQETLLQLPRQACLQKIEKVRTTYTAEEVSYSG